jgi:hypothetical protein
MKAYTSLWLIRTLTFELNDFLEKVERDSRKRQGARLSLKQFTRKPT